MTLAVQQTSVRNVLVRDVYPSRSYFNYGIEYTFTLTPELFPSANLSDIFEFLSKVISIPGSAVASLPVPLFYQLLTEYEEFYNTSTDALLREIGAYADTSESRRMWAVFKASSPEHIFATPCTPLNFFREYWASLCVLQDKQEIWETISTVFDAAKPWMNIEMYQKLQNKSNSTRTNAMFVGSDSDQDAIDRQLMERGRIEAEKRKMQSGDDIYIERGRKKKRGS